MPLNKDLVGKEYAPTTTEATLGAMQNYARAYNDDNPAFFDSTRTGGIVAPPMYAVVVTWPSIMGVVGDPDLKVDVVRLLHGEQDIEFIRPIRQGDKITAVAKVVSIETKARRDPGDRDQREESSRRAGEPHAVQRIHSRRRQRRLRREGGRAGARRAHRHGGATGRQRSDLSLQGGFRRFQSNSR